MPICDYCGFFAKSKYGLRQHIDGKPKCLEMDMKKAKELFKISTSVAASKEIRQREGNILNKEVSDFCAGLVKKAPPVASISTKRQREIEEEDIWDMQGYDSVDEGQKKKQVRRTFEKTLDAEPLKESNEDTASKIKKSRYVNLSSKQVGILEKYVAMGGYSGVVQEGDNVEATSYEIFGHYPSEEEVEYDYEDPSDDELSIIEADATTNNPPLAIGNPVIVPGNPVDDPDYNNDNIINISPNTKMLKEFKEYCRSARNFLPEFTKSQARSIRLMALLKRKAAPLSTYESIMEWHHREKGDMRPDESLTHVPDYINRSDLIKFLSVRYNFSGKGAKRSTVHLPNSKAKVTITTHNAWHCIESLLTDPRVNDEDYCFHRNDPFAPPPKVERLVICTRAKHTMKPTKNSSSFPNAKYFFQSQCTLMVQ